jgi:hypothetical protein
MRSGRNGPSSGPDASVLQHAVPNWPPEELERPSFLLGVVAGVASGEHPLRPHCPWMTVRSRLQYSATGARLSAARHASACLWGAETPIRADQAIPKQLDIRREQITQVSFSPDNVEKTGVSPGGQSGSPTVTAEADQVERTRGKTWSRVRSRFLCPTGRPGKALAIAGIALSCLWISLWGGSRPVCLRIGQAIPQRCGHRGRRRLPFGSSGWRLRLVPSDWRDPNPSCGSLP